MAKCKALTGSAVKGLIQYKCIMACVLLSHVAVCDGHVSVFDVVVVVAINCSGLRQRRPSASDPRRSVLQPSRRRPGRRWPRRRQAAASRPSPVPQHRLKTVVSRRTGVQPDRVPTAWSRDWWLVTPWWRHGHLLSWRGLTCDVV